MTPPSETSPLAPTVMQVSHEDDANEIADDAYVNHPPVEEHEGDDEGGFYGIDEWLSTEDYPYGDTKSDEDEDEDEGEADPVSSRRAQAVGMTCHLGGFQLGASLRTCYECR